MQKGKTILLVLEQEATWQVVFAPVTMMTFLEQTSSEDRFPISISGPLNQTPSSYVTATDKLAQILHYLALECTMQLCIWEQVTDTAGTGGRKDEGHGVVVQNMQQHHALKLHSVNYGRQIH
eukprot:1385971-Rhodomonas_salina.1